MTDALPSASLRSLALLLDVDRDVVRSAIHRAGLKPIGKRGGHDTFDMTEALRAMFARRGDVDPSLLTPIDRRALADARLRELELAKRSGQLVAREDVSRSSATAFAMVANACRSIPDRLERIGLSPAMAEEAERQIDATLDDLANQLEAVVKEAERLEAASHTGRTLAE